MVRFWVTFALLVAAAAAVWELVGGPGEAMAFVSGRSVHVDVSQRGSGVSASQSRTVGAFDRIHAEGASHIDIEVRDGLATAVEVRADDNLLAGVRTEVVNGVLEIAPPEGAVSYNDLQVKVTAPSLSGIHLEGANTLSLAIDSTRSLDVHSEGAGRINAKGKVDAMTLHSEGAGSIDAENLVARTVEVRLEGAGRANVHATQSLKARIDGAGIVRYAGNPASVDREIDGFGHISRID